MEFGGVYIVAETTPTQQDIARLVKYVQGLWPCSIFEAPGVDPSPIERVNILRHNTIKECVIYENNHQLNSWEEFGRTDDNADSVVYARLEPERLIFLVGRPDSPIGKLVRALASRLTTPHSLPESTHRMYVDRAILRHGPGIHRQVEEVACI